MGFYIEGPWVEVGVPGFVTFKNLILHKHTLKMEHDMKTSVLLVQVALVLFVNHPVNVNIMQFRGNTFIASVLWWWYWVQPTVNVGKNEKYVSVSA